LRPTFYVRALLALAAAFLLGGTLLAAPAVSKTTTDLASRDVSARAVNCRPHCWVAVSFNTDTLRGGWTQTNKWGSKATASASALNHCRTRDVNAGHARACVAPSVKDTYAQNACVGIAWLTRDGHLVKWVKATAYGPILAERKARHKLDGRGTKAAGHACSPRHF
jgi:hypothetical protein